MKPQNPVKEVIVTRSSSPHMITDQDVRRILEGHIRDRDAALGREARAWALMLLGVVIATIVLLVWA